LDEGGDGDLGSPRGIHERWSRRERRDDGGGGAGAVLGIIHDFHHRGHGQRRMRMRRRWKEDGCRGAKG
jgi:hypothetical protein